MTSYPVVALKLEEAHEKECVGLLGAESGPWLTGSKEIGLLI